MSLTGLSSGIQKDGFATVTGSAQQFEDLACDLVRFKVLVGNTVFVGDATPSFPVLATDDTGWISCQNLNQFWHSTGAGGSSGTVYWMALWD